MGNAMYEKKKSMKQTGKGLITCAACRYLVAEQQVLASQLRTQSHPFAIPNHHHHLPSSFNHHPCILFHVCCRNRTASPHASRLDACLLVSARTLVRHVAGARSGLTAASGGIGRSRLASARAAAQATARAAALLLLTLLLAELLTLLAADGGGLLLLELGGGTGLGATKMLLSLEKKVRGGREADDPSVGGEKAKGGW